MLDNANKGNEKINYLAHKQCGEEEVETKYVYNLFLRHDDSRLK